MQQQPLQQQFAYPANSVGVMPQTYAPMMMQQQRHEMKVNSKGIVGLGITQILAGAANMMFGLVLIIISRKDGFDDYGWSGIGGIAFGMWITITGCLGVMSSRRPASKCYNGMHLGFSITACIFNLAGITMFAFIFAYLQRCRRIYQDYGHTGIHSNWYDNYRCEDRTVSKAIAGCLLILHVIDFFVGLTSAILCCIYSCKAGCCGDNNQVLVVQPGYPHQQFVITSSAGNTVMSSAQHFPVSAAYYPTQSAPAYYPNQPISSQANYTQAPGATQVTYSTEQRPPQYSTEQPPQYVEKAEDSEVPTVSS